MKVCSHTKSSSICPTQIIYIGQYTSTSFVSSSFKWQRCPYHALIHIPCLPSLMAWPFTMLAMFDTNVISIWMHVWCSRIMNLCYAFCNRRRRWPSSASDTKPLTLIQSASHAGSFCMQLSTAHPYCYSMQYLTRITCPFCQLHLIFSLAFLLDQ